MPQFKHRGQLKYAIITKYAPIQRSLERTKRIYDIGERTNEYMDT